MSKRLPEEQVHDSGGLRRWRIELPNLLDELGLSLPAFRLYVHYKKVAGAKGGSCWEGIRSIAKTCKTTPPTVKKARDELVKANLITVDMTRTEKGHIRHTVKIVDIWETNFAHYSSSNGAHRDTGACTKIQYRGLYKNPVHKKEPIKNKKEQGISPSALDDSVPEPPGVSISNTNIPIIHRDPDSLRTAVGSTVQALTPADLVDLYNKINNLHGNPLPMARMTTQRKEKALLRLKENPDVAFWESVFVVATTDPFYSGASGMWDGMNFGWTIHSEEQAVRLAERATKPKGNNGRTRTGMDTSRSIGSKPLPNRDWVAYKEELAHKGLLPKDYGKHSG